MLHIGVRQGYIQHLYLWIMLMNIGRHRQPVAALEHIFLQSHQLSMTFCQPVQQICVNGLHKAAVGQRTGKSRLFPFFSHVLRRAHHASHCQKGVILLLKEHFAFPVLHRRTELPQSPVGLPSRVANCQGPVVSHGKIQHILQFPQIFRSHHAHIGHGGQIGVIKDSLMGFSVAPHQPGPVNAEQHRKILNAHVVNHLVIPPLEKRGVHSHHRPQPRGCHSRRRGHRVLFCNSHIEKPARKTSGKRLQSRSVRHGRRHRHNPGILLRQLTDFFRENICVVRILLFFLQLSGLHIKGTDPVEAGGIFLRGSIPFSFFCQHVNQNRVIQLLGFPEHLLQSADVVTVYRPQIGDSHIFKKHSRNHKLLDAVFRPRDLVNERFSHHRQLFQTAVDYPL